jgi:hypothetical protein
MAAIDSETLARLNASVGGLPGEREEVLAQLERMDVAAADPGVCGQLRRAVARSELGFDAIARAAQLDWSALQAFLEDREPLDSTAFGRLAAALGLTLACEQPPLCDIAE